MRAEADLHLRFTSAVNRPTAEVLYDPARQTFALGGYLTPAGNERYGSARASVALEVEALDGDLVLRLDADTGEARRRAFPEVVPVCLTPATGTGLATAGGPGCAILLGRTVLPLESTLAGPSELTLNGRPAEDELSSTWLVRELSATLAVGRAGFARLSAGRRRAVVGDGLVHDDYSAVAGVSLDLGAIGPPFLLGARLLVPDRAWPGGGAEASPMVAVEAAWTPSLFESVGLFAAAARDRGQGVAASLRGQYVEQFAVQLVRAQAAAGVTDAERDAAVRLASALSIDARSEASLAWVGTSGALSPWQGHRLSWTLAALEGTIASIDVRRGRLVEDVALHGRAARASWALDLPASLSAEAAFLWLSGGTLPLARGEGGALVPGTGEYRGFLGVAPFVPHTNLFFGGGLTDTFAAREATAPGVNGRGVRSPALRLAWDPSERIGFEGRVAWLWADVAGPYGGKDYGFELDLVASLSPTPWLAFGVEVDALWPGDFYGGRDTVYKTVLAVDVLTP